MARASSAACHKLKQIDQAKISPLKVGTLLCLLVVAWVLRGKIHKMGGHYKVILGVIFPKTPRKLKVLVLFQTFLEKINKIGEGGHYIVNGG